MAENSVQKVPYLEGLRGVAALLVVLQHFMLSFYPAAYTGDTSQVHILKWELWYYASPLNFLTNGNFCVALFFVLSGYVLTRKYFHTNDIRMLVSAAHQRFFRLYIPVACTICLSFILVRFSLLYHVEAAVISHSEWWLKTLWPDTHSFLSFAKALLYRVMFQGDNAYDVSLWTMSIEFFGSMLVFAFLAITHESKFRKISAVFVLLVLYAAKLFYYPAFLFGIGMNYLERFVARVSFSISRSFISLGLFLSGLLLGSFPSMGYTHDSFWQFVHVPQIIFASVTIHVIGATLLVASVLLSQTVQRVLASRVCVFLGFISFSLYLLHPLVIGSYSSALLLRLQPLIGYNHAGIVVLISSMLLCIVLSYIMAKYIDTLSVRLAKRISLYTNT